MALKKKDEKDLLTNDDILIIYFLVAHEIGHYLVDRFLCNCKNEKIVFRLINDNKWNGATYIDKEPIGKKIAYMRNMAGMINEYVLLYKLYQNRYIDKDHHDNIVMSLDGQYNFNRRHVLGTDMKYLQDLNKHYSIDIDSEFYVDTSREVEEFLYANFCITRKFINLIAPKLIEVDAMCRDSKRKYTTYYPCDLNKCIDEKKVKMKRAIIL